MYRSVRGFYDDSELLTLQGLQKRILKMKSNERQLSQMNQVDEAIHIDAETQLQRVMFLLRKSYEC